MLVIFCTGFLIMKIPGTFIMTDCDLICLAALSCHLIRLLVNFGAYLMPSLREPISS
jgi:hypothetical protein